MADRRRQHRQPPFLNLRDRIGVAWGAPNERDSEAEDTLRTMVQTGFKWHRITISWELIETSDGGYSAGGLATFDQVIDKLILAGAKIVAIVTATPSWARGGAGTIATPPTDLGKYAEFMTYVVNRYKDRIKYWEIWNEPDLAASWDGTVAQYAELLSKAYDAVVAEDANAVVLYGGLAQAGGAVANWFEDSLDDASFPCVNKFHVMSWHIYEGKGDASSRVATMKSAMASRSISRPIWVTECGWSSTQAQQGIAGFQDGAPGQARWALEMIPFYLNQLELPRVFWYTARDDTVNKGPAYSTHGLVTETTHVFKLAGEQIQRMLAL